MIASGRVPKTLIILSFSAAECFAVNASVKVDHYSVTILGFAVLYDLHSCLALLYSFEFFLNFLVADNGLNLFDLEAFIVLNVKLREYLNGSGQYYRLTVFYFRRLK